MPLHNSRKLTFATKLNKVFRIRGHGLIQANNSLSNRLKQMTLDHISMHGVGVAARKHIQGGTIGHYDRPYEPKHHQHQKLTPISFRL